MKKIVGIAFLVTGISVSCAGQGLLSKSISLDVNRQRLDNVLEILSNRGDFYFSYNSKIVKKDSLITLSVHSKTVREILSLLFNNTYEFRESWNYFNICKGADRDDMIN